MVMLKACGLAVSALLLAGLSGCGHGTGWFGGRDTSSAGLDRDASQACAVFAEGRRHATEDRTRLRLADNVNRVAGRSDTDAVKKQATRLGREADKGTEAWNASSAALARACSQAGWRPKT